MGCNKSISRLTKAAEKQGWRVERTKSSHIKFVPPQGQIIFASSTPSDWRSMKNLTRALCRQGMVVR